MKYENLNKENFWNEMLKEYPKAMNVFCHWVDVYKKRNNFNELFKADIAVAINLRGGLTPITSAAPKYHELPLAFQVGMWIEFLDDLGASVPSLNVETSNWRYEIPKSLFEIEKEVLKK